MKTPRKTGICRRLDLTCTKGDGTFLAHNEQMRHFRQAHGDIAGPKVTVMMKLPFYIMPVITDNQETTDLVSAIELLGLIPMRRPSLCLFYRN